MEAKIIQTSNKKAKLISVEMGKVIFNSKEIPTNFITNEVIGQHLEVGKKLSSGNCRYKK